MARDFEFSNAADRIAFTSHADYTSTISLSLWVKPESNPGTNQTVYFTKNKSAANSDINFRFLWTPGGGGDMYVVFTTSSSTFHEWKIDYTPTTGVWTHFYVSTDWTTNPDTVKIWINGVSQTVTHNFGSNNVTPDTTATQVIYIGGPAAGDPNFTDGSIAEVGVWSDLDESRVTPLSKRFSPLFFPNNRKEYIPLIREDINYHGGTGTPNGTPTIVPHPPIIYPANYQIAPFAAGGAPATAVKDFIMSSGFIPFAR